MDDDNRAPASGDANLDGAFATVEKLDEIGSAAYLQNGPVLIAEAAMRAQVAEATTNRIRLLADLLAGAPDTLRLDDRAAVTAEHDRLVRSVVTRAEA